MPVYSPLCGIVSHSGEGARPGSVWKWVSPRTSISFARTSGYGYGGSGRTRALGARRYATIAASDIISDAAKYGVRNQSVAYPYASTRYTSGARSAINPRNTSSRDTG